MGGSGFYPLASHLGLTVMLQTMTIVTICLCFLSLSAGLVAAQSVASQAYTPVAGACPNGFTLVRMAGSPGHQSLSTSEAAYVQARRSQVIPQAWKTYLANVEATKVALPSYVSSILNGSSCETPSFGIATSGGGYRAAIFGAGVLNALDGRNASSNSAGIGGLLQAATYITGLNSSSDSLILSSANNSWGGWNADYGIDAPSSNPVTVTQYLINLIEELKGKYRAGYPVTFADYWSRTLARHFVNGTFSSNFFDESYTHGAGILWSSVAETESFASYAIPFPIVVSDLSAPGQDTSSIISGDFIPISNPLIEFNVFEMGSFDPMLSAFAPTKYLGTTNNSVCVTNYDQSSLVAGSSSELFNTFNLTSTLGDALTLLNSLLPDQGVEHDVASWPNPFYGIAPETFLSSNQTVLKLVDGGEDGENIPVQPLLVKARGLDTILAIDASGDVHNFADGSALIATQDRITLLSPAYSFPPVPTSPGEFIAQNLTTRPTFFGCNTTSANDTTPLLIYLANGGPPHNGQAPVTNISTFQLSSSSSTTQAILDQIFIIATQGYPANSSMTTDPEWPACLACAIVDRARERAGETRSGVCACCFARYCWSGSTLGINATQDVTGQAMVHSSHRGWFSTLVGMAVNLCILGIDLI
ncbi:hypothetical protein JVT61DRAFT_6037 [Boletus reticuloceps]|uniref:Lysophospholipase n=1 Tax=Boletus reticuloceps TaxID=495285 RepID=A0A8I2YJY8_9AGAM|nr:hypothetical protein JVT61DRAFT_6037 [Boletus reticuloceps]